MRYTRRCYRYLLFWWCCRRYNGYGVFGFSYSLSLVPLPLFYLFIFPFQWTFTRLEGRTGECDGARFLWKQRLYLSLRPNFQNDFEYNLHIANELKCTKEWFLSRRLHIRWITLKLKHTHTQLNHFNLTVFMSSLPILKCVYVFMCHWHNLYIVRMHKIQWKYMYTYYFIDSWMCNVYITFHFTIRFNRSCCRCRWWKPFTVPSTLHPTNYKFNVPTCICSMPI